MDKEAEFPDFSLGPISNLLHDLIVVAAVVLDP